MRIYITLPFTGTTRDKSGDLSANLMHDYELNFKTTSRYKFKRELRIGTHEKDSGLNDSRAYHRWIYTSIDPETFHIYQEGD